MPRILIAECKQEVSTFNPHLSGYEDFGIRRGRELIDYHRTVRNEIGGALSVFDAVADVEIVPAYSAFFISSGGTLAKAAWERIADEFLESIRVAPPVDGVYFCMHGAMASEEELDPEGWLLAETRKILGEEIPIVVSLDLHGILTDRMVEHSDAVVAYHTYPHVDFFETGERAARLLLRVVAGEVKPVTAKVAIPALVRGDELITATGRFGESIRMSQIAETNPHGLSAGLFIGNRGAARAMSDKVREHLFTFWEVIDELLNSVLFLLIGLEVLVLTFDPSDAMLVAATVPIVLVGRLVSVSLPISLLAIRQTFSAGSIPVLTWGGLRGGVSVALALALPESDAKPVILTITYAVVIFSIVVQGLTVKWVIRKTVRPEDIAPASPAH